MNLADRPIAYTDVETFGIDENIHDLVEVSVIMADQRTLEEITSFSTKVIPKRLELALPHAIKMNGYNAEDWRDAVPLRDAMADYGRVTKNGMMAAWNMALDSRFIIRGFRVMGIPDEMDYHRIDLFTLAWERMRRMAHPDKVSLETTCTFFGIEPETLPHRGINGARKILEIHRALRKLA